MNWKTSLGFGLLLALFFWSMNAQTEAQREQLTKDSLAHVTDSLAKADAASKAPKGPVLPELRASNAAAPGSLSPSSPLAPPPGTPGAAPVTPALAPVAGAQAPVAAAVAAAAVSGQPVEATAPVVAPVAVPRRTIVVENKKFIATFDSRGAQLRSLILKSLPDTSGKFPELLYDTAAGALALKYDEADFSQADFEVVGSVADRIEVQGSTELKFVWSDVYGRKVERRYTFTDSSDAFGIKAKVIGFQPKTWTLTWNAGMRETEPFLHVSTIGPAGYFFSEVVINNTYNVQREMPEELTYYNQDKGKVLWAGLRRKYVASVIDFKGESDATIQATPIKGSDPDDQGTWALSINHYMQGDSIDFKLMTFPLVHSDLVAKGEMYEKIMFSGWEWMAADKWFVWLSGIILWILNAFYGLIPNYGIAIILLTLVVKFATLPLTLKQLRSTREMMLHKPEIDAIRTRNRSNPQKMQAELMEYYRRTGMNPLAPLMGCFPMLLQMPVFIALFVVLGRAVELRSAPFFGWITDLSHADVVWSALKIPYIMPMGFSLLPLIMAYTTWYQMKQTITDPQQKAMIWMMPIMMLVFSGVMPSGLVIYWIVGNIFGISQFWLINRGTKLPVPAKAAEEVKYTKVKK